MSMLFMKAREMFEQDAKRVEKNGEELSANRVYRSKPSPMGFKKK
ncbi:hypothetical protein [Bacillus sp. SG-1]|nr:hypothetical protein [Bacillus sp. SG-1]